MAKLEGILQLRGTIGNMTFSHTENGIVVREKSKLTKERIETDPVFIRTRENMAEFSTAGKSAKLLSAAFRTSLPHAKGKALFPRLLKLMKFALNEDVTNLRGLRTVIDGDLSIAEGFNFNDRSPLGSMFYVPFTTSVDRVTGELEVTLPVYIPVDTIVAPPNATHYKIVATGAELNFTDYTVTKDIQSTGFLSYDSTASTLATLTCALPANSTHPLALSLGIEFYMQVGATKYPLKDGSAHAIVKLDA
jgi:hypothetical protein